ncbi:hypothetical protein GZL_01421 [Streptomyces sp. 769]|nr:hypothetical protein GZL_01421 [Streptomyces sp. 769]
MANALAGWYPKDAEKCQGWDFSYVGYDIDTLVARLKRNTRNGFLSRHLTEVGVHPDADPSDPFSTCEGLH